MLLTSSICEVPSQGTQRVRVQKAGPADLQAVLDWTDCYLQGDYFFRRGHMRGILARTDGDVWWVIVDSAPAGLAITYQGSTLHNLYLAPAFRRQGIGEALLAWLNPRTIRAKTNMLAGDPVGFYQRCGYTATAADPNRPWIVRMDKMTPFAPTPIANTQGPPPQGPPPPPLPPPPPPSSAEAGQPTMLIVKGELLKHFLKFAKWQAASKQKQEAARRVKQEAAAAAAARHLPAPAWDATNSRWVYPPAPPAAAPLVAPSGQHEVSSFDEVLALCGQNIPPQ